MKDYASVSKNSRRPYELSVLAFIALSALSLSACRTIKSSQSRVSTSRDSIVVIEKIRDTTVVISADSSLYQALLECDSMGRVRTREILELRNGQRITAPQVTLKDNVVTARAQVDSMAVYLHLKDRYESRYATDTVYVELIKEVEKNGGLRQVWLTIIKALVLLAVAYAAVRRIL